jgi:hypothetical protein
VVPGPQLRQRGVSGLRHAATISRPSGVIGPGRLSSVGDRTSRLTAEATTNRKSRVALCEAAARTRDKIAPEFNRSRT